MRLAMQVSRHLPRIALLLGLASMAVCGCGGNKAEAPRVVPTAAYAELRQITPIIPTAQGRIVGFTSDKTECLFIQPWAERQPTFKVRWLLLWPPGFKYDPQDRSVIGLHGRKIWANGGFVSVNGSFEPVPSGDKCPLVEQRYRRADGLAVVSLTERLGGGTGRVLRSWSLTP